MRKALSAMTLATMMAVTIGTWSTWAVKATFWYIDYFEKQPCHEYHDISKRQGSEPTIHDI